MNAYFPAAAKKKTVWSDGNYIQSSSLMVAVAPLLVLLAAVVVDRCGTNLATWLDRHPPKRKCTRSLFHSGLLCHDHDSAAPSTRIPPSLAYVNVNNSDNTLRLPNWTYFGSLVRSVGRSFTCNNIRKVPMRLKHTLKSKHIFRFRCKCTRASIISSVVGDELPKTSRAVERIIEFLGYRFNWSKARGLVSSPVWLGGWRTARQ